MNGLYRGPHQNVLQGLLHQSLPPSSSAASSKSFNPRFQIRSEGSDLWQQLLGGRGLPGGENYLKDESKRKTLIDRMTEGEGRSGVKKPLKLKSKEEEEEEEVMKVKGNNEGEMKLLGDNGFEKEMMGLTGGFPGGETGLRKFIEENPAPAPSSSSSSSISDDDSGSPPVSLTKKKASAPPLPLLMPGMTVIVKNPRSPFHMYGGIVQRVSDGRVGVLLEGGNWDKLLTFYLEELERTPSGPPMINPKSGIILLDQSSSSSSSSS